jgi:hypothetical protein
MIETSIIGVEFDACYQTRIVDELDEVEINMIDFENLMKNKKASGRPKDLIYFERLQQKKKAMGSWSVSIHDFCLRLKRAGADFARETTEKVTLIILNRIFLRAML